MASIASSGSAGRHLGLDPVECLWQRAKSTALRFNYSATPGPTVSLAPDHSASGIFCHFFTDDVRDLLTTETNRHAAAIVGRTCRSGDLDRDCKASALGTLLVNQVLTHQHIRYFICYVPSPF